MKISCHMTLILIYTFSFILFLGGCDTDKSLSESISTNFMYEPMILSELPDSAIPFCDNNIPVSGGYHMIMCEDSNEPLGYSAFVKDSDGMYTKVNLLIPDTIVFDSVKLLAMPSGGGGSGEDTLYLELTTDNQTEYIFFTTSLFSNEYWWNYEYCGEAPYSAEDIQQCIIENKKMNSKSNNNS